MKKTYVYFLVPIIGVIAFGAVYWNFSEGYEAKLAAKAAQVREEKAEKLRIEAKNREQAIKDALAAQDRRRAEKADREAKEKADAEARQLAIEARDKANRDQAKLAQQVTALEKDIKNEKEIIAKLEEERRNAVQEHAFLQQYVKQAEANAKSLTEVIDRITAADTARAAADALAARSRNS
jgi:colicin import membrane protein